MNKDDFVTLFRELQSSGFNIKDTHVPDLKRLFLSDLNPVKRKFDK